MERGRECEAAGGVAGTHPMLLVPVLTPEQVVRKLFPTNDLFNLTSRAKTGGLAS